MVNVNELRAQIALMLLPGMGHVQTKRIIAAAGSASVFFEDPAYQDLRFLAGIPLLNSVSARAWVDSGIRKQCLEKADAELEICYRFNTDILSYQSPEYPVLLKKVADAPTVLFKQGNFSFHQNAGQVPVAIVGTRGPSDYGKKQARFFGKSLALAGLHIVSGLALGIDTEAHEGALEAGIPTTAVLGHGFGTIYPAVNKKLAARIRENGCLLTEQLHDVEPEAHSFPARNRIVAGICRATIVIESRIKGGALITAEYALSQHREVMVLPGNVNSEVSAGCHALIRKSSAGLVTCPQDVLEDLGLGANGTFFQTPSLFEEPAAWSSLTPTEEKILLALGNGEQHIDVLAHETGIPQADLLALLFTLEMAGWIQNLPGQRIKRLA